VVGLPMLPCRIELVSTVTIKLGMPFFGSFWWALFATTV